LSSPIADPVQIGFVASLNQQDKSKRQKEKPIQLPSFDFNGYSGRLTADQSRIWETPDRPANFKPGKARANPTSA
jgi:hypothetical protein